MNQPLIRSINRSFGRDSVTLRETFKIVFQDGTDAVNKTANPTKAVEVTKARVDIGG